ncbi:hypothetical protein [Paradevosia shaoguanensis]|uniref:hypothetical protein n=1 Tax=Paradevosia shaoguanensis TaxID=1335043 RepID=UPI003C779A91
MSRALFRRLSDAWWAFRTGHSRRDEERALDRRFYLVARRLLRRQMSAESLILRSFDAVTGISLYPPEEVDSLRKPAFSTQVMVDLCLSRQQLPQVDVGREILRRARQRFHESLPPAGIARDDLAGQLAADGEQGSVADSLDDELFLGRGDCHGVLRSPALFGAVRQALHRINAGDFIHRCRKRWRR